MKPPGYIWPKRLNKNSINNKQRKINCKQKLGKKCIPNNNKKQAKRALEFNCDLLMFSTKMFRVPCPLLHSILLCNCSSLPPFPFAVACHRLTRKSPEFKNIT